MTMVMQAGMNRLRQSASFCCFLLSLVSLPLSSLVMEPDSQSQLCKCGAFYG